ncbi:hypothetical protein WSM22_23150 [Cytophagales bacterium WSM2-2]|nr:hypothetical protein WSM22_23150 [Cytophagales bacterium WSM2-2]
MSLISIIAGTIFIVGLLYGTYYINRASEKIVRDVEQKRREMEFWKKKGRKAFSKHLRNKKRASGQSEWLIASPDRM